MNYWLMKSEGQSYSIDHLKADKTTPWSGVRNYQARNFMTRDMKVGDGVLFYHADSKPSGIYGIAKIVGAAKPDLTQFEKKGMYYDPKATRAQPIWHCVDVGFVEKLKNPVPLSAIKSDPALRGILVARPGSRLSIQPVSENHFKHIRAMGK